ncbi:MAG: M28 family peptidase, partial [Actinobacteria bacterium]|nr:M28 family peptidase [Actinomycetota bacterium]
GVAAVLELARLIRAEPPALPVRLVAFGAEEPRGAGDDMHHFGSQQFVR